MVSLFFRKFATKTKLMKTEIKTSDVKTLCFYTSDAGQRIWVGECESGYFYGGAGFAMFTNSLSCCFRLAPAFSSKEEAVKVAQLSVERGAPLPSWLQLDNALVKASFYASKGKKRNNDFLFAL